MNVQTPIDTTNATAKSKRPLFAPSPNKPILKRPLFAPTLDEPIVDHAIYHAANGWRVFPVPPGTKKSHKSANHSDGRPWGATTNTDEIAHDFKRWPDANLGIVTGAISGIFVVETDTAEGHGEGVDGAASLAELEAKHGALPPTLQAESPSGSIHYYFRHPAFKIKNSASEVASGIDVRGDGGMVVAPPSVKPGRGAYKWRNNLPVADAPQWLLDRIITGNEKPEPQLTISQQAAALVRPPRDGFDDIADEVRRRESGGYSRAYLNKALDDERAIVANTSKGSRNTQLNKSSFALGQLVPHGLSEKEVIDAMFDAATTCRHLEDKGRKQTMDTINSGLRDGIATPRPLPKAAAPDQTADKVIPIHGTINPKPSLALPLTFFNEVENFPPKNWLIKDMIARMETTRIVAPPGKGKSALAIDLVVHVAAGLDWRGHKSKDKCGVVYFALERADLVKRRLAGHRLRDGLDDLPIAVAGQIINLMHASCVDIIVATIREAEKTFGCGVGLIVLDVYPKGVAAGGGDENQAKDQGIAITYLARVKELTGVHIMNVAHTGKDESKSTRGSNAQTGDDDVTFQISGDDIKTVKIVKINDGEERVVTKFKLERCTLGEDEDGEPITTAIVSLEDCGTSVGKSARTQLNPTERRIMELLYGALNDHGQAPPSNEFPHGIKVVSRSVWRTACERGGMCTGDDADAREAFRRKFDRTVLSLTNMHRIGTLDGLVWVAYD